MEDFKDYKINLFNSRGYYFIVRPILLIFTIDILAVLLIGYYYEILNEHFFNLFLMVFCFSFILYLGPLLGLIFNYIIKNNQSSLRVYFTNDILSKIEYFSKGECIDFEPKSIKSIEINLSSTGYDNRYKWLFWDEYFYYKIILNNNTQIFIPCILCDQLDEMFDDFHFKKIKRIFPIYISS